MQLLAGRDDAVEPVLRRPAPGSARRRAGRRDLRLHVADHQLRGADVVAQDLPHRLVPPPGLVDLDGLELQPFRVGVDRVDDAAAPRVSAPMSRWWAVVTEKPISSPPREHRHAEADVGPVRGAVVGRVVHDHVAGLERLAALAHAPQDAAQVAGDRARAAAAWSAASRTAAGPRRRAARSRSPPTRG